MRWHTIGQVVFTPNGAVRAIPPGGASDTGPSLAAVVAVVLAVLAVVLGLFLLWRVRQLRRSLLSMAKKQGQEVEVARQWRMLPRFGLKTLIVLSTCVAVVLGTFGAELLRARRQANVLNALAQLGNMSTNVSASYDLGLLGDSRSAAFICHWVHPHFGCRVSGLAINSDGYSNYAEQLLMDDGGLASIAHLQSLTQLQISNADIGPQVLAAIGRLKKLRRLSFHDCRLPENLSTTLKQLNKLEFLELCKCGVVDSDLQGLAALPALTHLDVSWNPLTDEGMTHVAQATQLRVLNIGKTSITGAALDNLTALDQLHAILLNETKVELDDLPTLLELPQLREVALYGSSVGWALKPSEHGKAEAIFADRPEVRLVWTPPGTVNTWKHADNRPVLYDNSGTAFPVFRRGGR